MADDESDPPTGPMNEHAARIYLALCRESVLEQERSYRDYASKATGVITFSLAMLGIAGQWFFHADGGGLGTVILAIMCLCVVLIALPALSVIRRPLDERAWYNLETAAHDARHTASGKAVGATLIDAAEYYRVRIDFDTAHLYMRMQVLTMIFMIVVVEAVFLGYYIVLTASQKSSF